MATEQLGLVPIGGSLPHQVGIPRISSGRVVGLLGAKVARMLPQFHGSTLGWESELREKGTVKFWNSEKGFGFVLRDGQPDCFIHISDLTAAGLETLHENQPLSFDVVAGREGRPKAQNISIGLP